MSIDYMVYLRREPAFDAAQFEKYAASLGISLQTDPSFIPGEHEGYLPFRLVYGENSYKSGFEYYSEPYEEVEAEPVAVKQSFFQKVFGKQQISSQQNEFDRAICGAKWLITLQCSSSADSFECLLAWTFAAYFCRYVDGILDDPQTGTFYTQVSEIEKEIRLQLEELQKQAQNGELIVHEFDGWE